MECSFGLAGKDYVLLASDTTAGRSIIQMKSDENKIIAVGPHMAMAVSGEPGDTRRFADYIDRNMRLYHIRNQFPLSPASSASWIRRTLATSLRSRSPWAVNLLLAGYDTTSSTPSIHWIDYLGTKADIPYAAHGLGMYVALSTMDKWWYQGIDKREGLEVLRKCINEVELRLTVKFSFNCILIDKDGVHQIDLASADPIAEIEGKAQVTAAATADAPVSSAPIEITA